MEGISATCAPTKASLSFQIRTVSFRCESWTLFINEIGHRVPDLRRYRYDDGLFPRRRSPAEFRHGCCSARTSDAQDFVIVGQERKDRPNASRGLYRYDSRFWRIGCTLDRRYPSFGSSERRHATFFMSHCRSCRSSDIVQKCTTAYGSLLRHTSSLRHPDRRNDRSAVGHHSSTTDWITARTLARQESLMNN